MKVPILSADDIEAHANDVLAQFAQLTGQPLSLPIPIDQIIDHVLDIPVLWKPIADQQGRVIVSKLAQPSLGQPARIIMNEALAETRFRDCPGLTATALAHEAGHGVFHLEPGRIHQYAFDFAGTPDFTSAEDDLTELLDRAIAQRGPLGDDRWREWQAHTFMRFVLMPRVLLLPALAEYGGHTWRELYSLRECCGVTISALTVHLSKLGLLHVERRERNRDVSPRWGQQTLA